MATQEGFFASVKDRMLRLFSKTTQSAGRGEPGCHRPSKPEPQGPQDLVHEEVVKENSPPAGEEKDVAEHAIDQDKDKEILRLMNELTALQNTVNDQKIEASKVDELQKNLLLKLEKAEKLHAQQQAAKTSFYSDEGPTPPLLQTAVDVVKEAIMVCASELLSRMKKSSLPITFVCMNLDLEASPAYILKFSLQSFHCHIIFKCFEDPCFGEWAISQEADFWQAYQHSLDMDVKELLEKDAAFGRFLDSKDAELRLQLKEKFFLTEDVQKAEDFFTSELSRGAKNSTYYTKWARLVKAVWVLHNLAFAFEPSNAEVLRVGTGSVLDAEMMEDVTPEHVEDDDKEVTEEEEEKVKEVTRVRFMCVPGFEVRNTIIKSRVFCVKR